METIRQYLLPDSDPLVAALNEEHSNEVHNQLLASARLQVIALVAKKC